MNAITPAELALRLKQEAERRAENDYQATRHLTVMQALDACRDADALRRVLNDAELAGPLAALMQAFEPLCGAIGAVERDRRLAMELLSPFKRAANAMALIERQLARYITEAQ